MNGTITSVSLYEVAGSVAKEAVITNLHNNALSTSVATRTMSLPCCPLRNLFPSLPPLIWSSPSLPSMPSSLQASPLTGHYRGRVQGASNRCKISLIAFIRQWTHVVNKFNRAHISCDFDYQYGSIHDNSEGTVGRDTRRVRWRIDSHTKW
jgi:hypothetical protein